MFYDNFIRICAERKESPSGVAKKIGLSNAAANGWKKGKQPSEVTLEKLSQYFGVPVSELTGEQKEKPAPEGEPDKEALLKYIDGLDESGLLDVLAKVTKRLQEKK